MTAYSNVSKPDPHKILGLNHNASKDEIRRAYKRLIQKYHPDKYQSNISFALKKTKALNQAYAILSGKIRRQWTVTKRKVKNTFLSTLTWYANGIQQRTVILLQTMLRMAVAN